MRRASISALSMTHLQSNKTIKVRGYQSFRSDRVNRTKQGIFWHSLKTTWMHATRRTLSFRCWKSRQTQQNCNYYCPNDKPMCLDTITTEDSNTLVVGDFNSHSQSWGGVINIWTIEVKKWSTGWMTSISSWWTILLMTNVLLQAMAYHTQPRPCLLYRRYSWEYHKRGMRATGREQPPTCLQAYASWSQCRSDLPTVELQGQLGRLQASNQHPRQGHNSPR